MVLALAPKPLLVPNAPTAPAPRAPLRLIPPPPPEAPTPMPTTRFGGAFGGVAFSISMLWSGKAAYDAVKAVPSQLPWMPGPSVAPEIWTDPKRVIEEAHARFGYMDTPHLNQLRFIREKQAVPVRRDAIHDPFDRNLMVQDESGEWVQVPLEGQETGALVIGDIWKNEFPRKPLHERASDEQRLIEIELGMRDYQVTEPKTDADKSWMEQYVDYIQELAEAMRKRANGENVPLPVFVFDSAEELQMPQSRPQIMNSAAGADSAPSSDPSPQQSGGADKSTPAIEGNDKSQQAPTFPAVLMDNDGHMDDLIALVVLSQLVGPALSSIIVSQGNSDADIAGETTKALLDYLGQANVPVSISDKPAKNDFPEAWRAMSKDFHAVIEQFIGKTKASPPASVQEAFDKWLNELQSASNGLIVATGPLTNISTLLEGLPKTLAEKVKLFWMGGALDAAGNVSASDGTQLAAEWNSYADPDAVAKLLKAGIELFIVPLDATNYFEVNKEMIEAIRSAESVIAQIVAALLEYSASKYNYYLWDPIASILAVYPHLATWGTMRLSVGQNGKDEGRLFRSDEGSVCHVATQISRNQIMDAICKSLGK